MINAIRAHLAEFGVTAPVGRKGIEELLRVIADPSDKRVPRCCACMPSSTGQSIARKLRADNHLAIGINAVDLKN